VSEQDLQQEIEAARATIASQAMLINQLQQQIDGNSTGALHQLLQISDIVGVTIGQAPYRSLLNGIVEAARRLFDAGASSILILDHETDELVFEAATGGGEVINMRIPSHRGIAGWVMMTGEPIAVGDVRRDPRFASDFAKSTGYMPQSIMAAPLIVGEDVEGVIEVLDKRNSASFGLDDMELLGLFARPAAIGVEQARLVTSIGRALVAELGRIAAENGNGAAAQAAEAALSDGAGADVQTIELARLVHSVGRRGERARQLALDILASVVKNT
jgi:GAF domain-containing protein